MINVGLSQACPNYATLFIWIFFAFYFNQSVSDCRLCSVYSSDIQMFKAFLNLFAETFDIGLCTVF